jgi:hypothetical protein
MSKKKKPRRAKSFELSTDSGSPKVSGFTYFKFIKLVNLIIISILIIKI